MSSIIGLVVVLAIVFGMAILTIGLLFAAKMYLDHEEAKRQASGATQESMNHAAGASSTGQMTLPHASPSASGLSVPLESPCGAHQSSSSYWPSGALPHGAGPQPVFWQSLGGSHGPMVLGATGTMGPNGMSCQHSTGVFNELWEPSGSERSMADCPGDDEEPSARITEIIEDVDVEAMPTATFEELAAGFSSHLSCKFDGKLKDHAENVAAVSHALGLDGRDLVCCYLCLVEAENSGLSLKRYATNVYAARVWVVAMARFVRYAQGDKGARKDARLKQLCEEWNYKPDAFIKELGSCEAPFLRKHGDNLQKAFKQPELLKEKLDWGYKVLGGLGKTYTTSGGNKRKLSLTDGDPVDVSSGNSAKARRVQKALEGPAPAPATSTALAVPRKRRAPSSKDAQVEQKRATGKKR